MKKLALLGLVSSATFAQGSWQTLFSGDKEPTFSASSVAMKEKIYVYGGKDVKNYRVGPVDEMWVYDTLNGEWSEGPSHGSADMVRAGAVECAGKLFFVGGRTHSGNSNVPSGQILVFDPNDSSQSPVGSWVYNHPLSSLPNGIARVHPAVACQGSDLYVHGGISDIHRGNHVVHGDFYKVNVNSPSASWEALPSSQISRAKHAGALVGNKFVIVGGMTDEIGRNGNKLTDTVEIYDFEKGDWEFGASLPSRLYRHTATADRNQIIVAGGTQNKSDKGLEGLTYIYSVGTDTWKAGASMGVARFNHSAVLVGGSVVVVGGFVEGGKQITSVIERYSTSNVPVQWEAKSNYIPRWNHYQELRPSVLMEKDKKVAIGNSSPTSALDISGNSVRIREGYTPASSEESCWSGTIAWDSAYMYLCTPSGWTRSAFTSW